MIMVVHKNNQVNQQIQVIKKLKKKAQNQARQITNMSQTPKRPTAPPKRFQPPRRQTGSQYGYYDAFENTPHSAVTAMSIGHATAAVENTLVNIQAPARFPNDENGSNVMLIFLYPFPGEVMGYVYSMSDELAAIGTSDTDWSNTAGDKWTAANKKLEVRAATWGAQKPSEVLPTRYSMRITNCGADYQKGGKVRFLRATTGMEPPATNKALLDLANKVRTHHRMKPYQGHELGKTRHMNAIVADAFKAGQFEVYQPQNGATDVTGPSDHYSKNMEYPSFTPLVILFEPYGTPSPATGTVTGGIIPNSYELQLAAHYFCHDIQGTRLGNQAILPSSDANHSNRAGNQDPDALQMVKDGMKAIGNAGMQAAGALMNTTPAQRRTARRMIGGAVNMWRRNRAIRAY